MPSGFQEPFSGQEYELYRSQKLESATSTLTAQQRKIDPMGMMGKIFACLGAILVVIGVLLASLLGHFEPRGFGFFFVVLAGIWGTGLLILLVGLVLRRFFRNVMSAIVADRYFMALVNQDYAAAFQYLNPGIMTYQNGLDAQTWFMQSAQAYDEQGKINDYTLRGFSLNLRSATYRIKVGRSTGSYIVHLFLLKRDGTWKITEFDRF